MGSSLYLLSAALALAAADSPNRSRNLPGSRKVDRNAHVVEQHWSRRFGKLQGALRVAETAGSPVDLKNQSAMGHQMHIIDAIVCPRELDKQQASVLEAKYPRPRRFVIRTRASVGRRWGIQDRAQITKGERA